MSGGLEYRPAWLGRLICRLFGHLDISGWSPEHNTAGWKCLRCKRVWYAEDDHA